MFRCSAILSTSLRTLCLAHFLTMFCPPASAEPTAADRERAEAILKEIQATRETWAYDEQRRNENPNALSKEAQAYSNSIRDAISDEQRKEMLRIDREAKAKRKPITFQSKSDFLGKLTELHDQAVAADPTLPQAWEARGLFRWQEQNPDDGKVNPLKLTVRNTETAKRELLVEAQNDLIKAAELNPANVDMLRNVVSISGALDDEPLLLEYARKTADALSSAATDRNAPDSLEKQQTVIKFRFLAHQWNEVVDLCNSHHKALRVVAGKSNRYKEWFRLNHRQRGLALVAVGKTKEASADLEAAEVTELEIVDFQWQHLSSSPAALVQLAKRQAEAAPKSIKNLDRAIAMLSKCIAQDANFAEAYFLRAKDRQLLLSIPVAALLTDVETFEIRARHDDSMIDADLETAEKLKYSPDDLDQLKNAITRARAIRDLPKVLADTTAKASSLVAEGRASEAAQLWTGLADSFPDKLQVRKARLEFLSVNASVLGPEEHSKELHAILDLLPADSPDRIELIMNRLRLMHQLQDYGIVRDYREFRSDLEASVTDRERLGWIAFESHHYDEAYRWLSKVFDETEGTHLDQLGHFARGPSGGGESESSELFGDQTAKPLARLSPAQMQELHRFRLERFKLQRDIFKRQVEVLRRLGADKKSIEVDNTAAWAHFCNALMAADDEFLGADSYMMAAFGTGPDSVLAQCWVASQLIASGGYDDAQKYIEIALRLNPKSSEAYATRGALRQAEYRFDEALADYARAIELSSRRQEAYLRRAQILFFQGLLEQAFDELAVAVMVEPPDRSLLLPQRLRVPFNGTVPSPSPRIAGKGPNADALASAQLKLARGDVRGAESILADLGDVTSRWQAFAYATPPSQPKAFKNYNEARDFYALEKSYRDSRAKELTELLKTDPAISFTLGMARATGDEDQELFLYREYPLASPKERQTNGERKRELAHWNFVAANAVSPDATTRPFDGIAGNFADLVLNLGPPRWTNPNDRSSLAPTAKEVRVDDVFRHNLVAYRRERLPPFPKKSVSAGEFNAQERFEKAIAKANTPHCLEDLSVLLRRIADEFNPKKPDQYYDAQLLALAAKIEPLPSHSYPDPLLPKVSAAAIRINVLELLKKEVGEAAKRQKDATTRKPFTDALADVERQLQAALKASPPAPPLPPPPPFRAPPPSSK
jgi:tetratricopeptide (TPR) repeat protein